MFFRLQQKGLTLEQMQSHKSQHGYDFVDGVCASDSAYSKSFGGSCDNEVVVLQGRVIEEIYDGVVIYPEKIIARHSFQEWCSMIEDGETEKYDTI